MNHQHPTGAMSRAVRRAYDRGQDDEGLEPLVLIGDAGPVGAFQPGDEVIFYNLRGEREIELCRALADPDFGHFPRPADWRVNLTTMIQYHPDLHAAVAFGPQEVNDTLCQVISAAGRQQLKISETEKAPHVTFFLNGKRHEALPGEQRRLIPSPKVADFARVPGLSASQVADAVVEALGDPGLDFIFVNLCNIDVIGHLEDEGAVIAAVEAVDAQAGRVLAAAGQAGVMAVVSADHGSAESWRYEDGRPNTGHTTSDVPFAVLGPGLESVELRSGGALADVAPTVLSLLGLEPPPSHTGRNLIIGATPERRRVLYLLIDGWGLSDGQEGNLIRAAATPHLDALLANHAWTRLAAAGEAVGMPPGSVGNSEVGHLHTGAGRIIPADRVRIDRAVADGTFYDNPGLNAALERAKAGGRRLHLIGIVSFYSSHGSVDHLYALLELCRRREAERLFVHSMLGRRGERHASGAAYIGQVEARLGGLGRGRLASVIGRYWSLDREGNWDRVAKAFRLYAHGEGAPVPEDR
ncbi:MAG: phosphoglycerate mutase (2,3-diphosphoglycerate-independent) [Proteobacteria bacterium]|nr:phosphoglycerate mutase (2,3-diphosphoglycerate-independent) [Pseudomonadota bacterium]